MDDGYGNEITTSLAKSINNIQRFRVISVAIPFRSMHSISTDDGQLYFTWIPADARRKPHPLRPRATKSTRIFDGSTRAFARSKIYAIGIE